jgi:hypothetical protein
MYRYRNIIAKLASHEKKQGGQQIVKQRWTAKVPKQRLGRAMYPRMYIGICTDIEI